MRLNQLGYASGSADGVFASQTEEALKRFQAAVGLPQTGVTDAATVTALNSARLAAHPAGRKPGTGQAGSGQPGGGQSSLPPAPRVTGDKVVDRAIQWLGTQMAPSATDGK
jgi:peptidoglycan hydrolase-like protein with peptidoglycan-binding domain